MEFIFKQILIQIYFKVEGMYFNNAEDSDKDHEEQQYNFGSIKLNDIKIKPYTSSGAPSPNIPNNRTNSTEKNLNYREVTPPVPDKSKYSIIDPEMDPIHGTNDQGINILRNNPGFSSINSDAAPQANSQAYNSNTKVTIKPYYAIDGSDQKSNDSNKSPPQVSPNRDSVNTNISHDQPIPEIKLFGRENSPKKNNNIPMTQSFGSNSSSQGYGSQGFNGLGSNGNQSLKAGTQPLKEVQPYREGQIQDSQPLMQQLNNYNPGNSRGGIVNGVMIKPYSQDVKYSEQPQNFPPNPFSTSGGDMLDPGFLPSFGGLKKNTLDNGSDGRAYSSTAASDGTSNHRSSNASEGDMLTRDRKVTFSQDAMFNNPENIVIFDNYDVLILQKKFTSVQMCCLCKPENRFTIFPHSDVHPTQQKAIYEVIEHIDPTSCNFFKTVDCEPLYMAMHQVKEDQSLVAQQRITIHKQAKCSVFKIAEEEYLFNAHTTQEMVSLGSMTVSGLHCIPTYYVYNESKQLEFVIHSGGHNICVLPMCGCQNGRNMSFEVKDSNGVRLSSLEHRKNTLNILFPPKISRKQRALYVCAALVIFQRHV